MLKKLALISALVVAVALGGYLWQGSAPEAAGSTLVSTAFAQDADAPATDAEPAAVIDMTLGNPDADVTLIEYASFTCIHCANFHNNSWDQLKADFIDSGKIKFVYREVYFDRFGLWAGMLARCQGPVKYFGIADLLFERRDDWLLKSDAEIADGLRRIGRIAGMNDETINACLADSAKAEALVAEYQKNKDADGVESTPSFLINGKNVRNPGYSALKELIEAELDG
jgi:protein-disulfide isomerase